MDIPLTVRKGRGSALIYGIPFWYRAVMGLILAVLTGAVFVSGGTGAVGWIFVAIALIGTLYVESWSVGPETVCHSYGIWPLLKHITIESSKVESLSLSAFVKGTMPGDPKEEAESRAILSSLMKQSGTHFARFQQQGAGSTDSSAESAGLSELKQEDKAKIKKAYISLILTSKDGENFVINTVPARRYAELLEAGLKLGGAAGANLEI